MDPASVTRRFQWFAVAAALALVLAPPVGCSSDGGAAPCVTSRCPAGEECLDDGSGQGQACHQVCTRSTGCPFNTFCNDGQPKSWCAPSSYPVVQSAGQWGTVCVPTGGEASNPDCDGADGFACYGTSPTDATSFCTVFGCAADSDCPGGWWCATVNRAPNVTTEKPSYGATLQVCLPRAYCAPCKLDHDCPASAAGTQQHCAPDSQGNGFCATECATDANCPLDATCKNWQSLCTPAQGAACESDEDCPALADGIAQHCDGARCTPECGGDGDCSAGVVASAPAGDAQASVAPAIDGKCQWRGLCTPRAGVCRGSGGFCSPCRSDADCTGGYCMSGLPYSTERFCSAKSTRIPCDTMDANPVGCPAHKTTDHWTLNACVTDPANQCEGFVVLGSSTGAAQELPGCWTANR